ncbi:pectinesterase-like [Hordeum vulgare subsp. vulgare]|uniref:Pectinesterase n=1 Tax=Hordeum vulgare subsp. vulgare TaxID=112509 RepID=A0A8I6WKT7_HORVV|nr:pectinesterase-like [Hordeum vulgare subsp. vulgare]
MPPPTPRTKRREAARLLLLATFLPLLLLTFLFAQTAFAADADHDGGHHHERTLLDANADAEHAAAVDRHCAGMLHREVCASALAGVEGLAQKPLGDVISLVVGRAASAVRSAASNCTSYLARPHRLRLRDRLALSDCQELFGHTLSQLGTAAAELSAGNRTAEDSVAGLQTVLSAAMTNQYTCLEGFAGPSASEDGRVRPYIQGRIYHVAHLVSNSLAMVRRLPQRRRGRALRSRTTRRTTGEEVFEGYGPVRRGFPAWVAAADRRRLLQESVPDLVVAKDGSGNFTTVTEAVAAAPNNSATRYVIHIKAGGYFENVEVGSDKTNIMFVGDGMWKTVIKASRNVVDNYTTFRSATLAVIGTGFLARDLTVENAAGPAKHQAVALRVNADLSAFYRCSFAGYQDTLYAHSLRQFYRDCDVYGTVDFVFGDAAALLQNCSLYARRPGPGQKNVFTAQGREDPNQNTGIAVQGCKVAAAADLVPVLANFSSYLGRPWKAYSRTVFMQSKMEALVHPRGWLEWNGTFALDTLYYAEYMNRGPGADTSARVAWPGYRVITAAADAGNFTAQAFIQGDLWLNSTSFPYTLGLG